MFTSVSLKISEITEKLCNTRPVNASLHCSIKSNGSRVFAIRLGEDTRNLRIWAISRHLISADFSLSLSIRNANASATRAAKDAKNAAPCTIRFLGGPAQLARAFTARCAIATATQRPAYTTRKWPTGECPWISVGNIEAVACASIARWDDKKITQNAIYCTYILETNGFLYLWE